MDARVKSIDLESIDFELRSLQERLDHLEARKKELEDISESSKVFNADDITNIMTRLMTKKEDTKYISFISIRNGFLSSTYFYAISRKEKASEYESELKKCYTDADLLKYKKLDDLVFICREHYDEVDLRHLNLEERKITFEFLKMKPQVNDESVRICDSDFGNFDYLYVFIEYLYDLQVRNNGKQLSLEEMGNALDRFLKMDDDTYNQYRDRVEILKEHENNGKKRK